MVNSVRQKAIAVVAVAAVAVAFGCGGDRDSRVSVDIFGWTDEGGGQFTEGLPSFPGADEMVIQVTDPVNGRVVEEQTLDVNQRRARMPEVTGGGTRRLDFEVRGGGEPIATGATPSFTVYGDGRYHGLRAMISRVDQFAPVGSRQRSAESGEFRFAESTFDIRQYNHAENWSGRMGHTAHTLDSGRVMIAGGGRLSTGYEPGAPPPLNKTLGDIQVFDPASGYFTELGAYDDAIEAGVTGQDRLADDRVFHTVTPVGDDRFVVAGGFQNAGGEAQPVSSVELIDMNAQPGQRVRPLGQGVQLQQARGFHTATWRESDGTIVIAGGVGAADDDIIDTIEIIDPEAGTIDSGIAMQSPRSSHSAVLLEDGETVWLMGGKSGPNQVATSTEVVTSSGVEPGPTLQQGRYAASALLLGDEGNNLVAIFGGFTDGSVTSSYELGNPLRSDDFFSGAAGNVGVARGGADIVVLPQTGDLVIVGGYDAQMEPVAAAERLQLDPEQLPPFHSDPGLGEMVHPRGDAATAMVGNGRLLITGGDAPGEVERNDAEYLNAYDPVE